MSQQDSHRRVYRENEKGQFVPVPIMATERPPTAEQVMAALRDFVRQAGPEDLILLRPDQARVLYQRCSEAAKRIRRVADGLDGGQQ